MPAAAAHARHQRAPPFIEPAGYARHRPETTLLYQLVEQHYPAFREMRATAGRSLPDYIEEEIDAYLKCGRLEEGFLRLRCEHAAMPRCWWRSAARSADSVPPAAQGAWPRPQRC